MGWVGEEYNDRLRAMQPRDDNSTPEMIFERAALARWKGLVRDLEEDVNEYSRQGGNAEFTRDSDYVVRITDRDTALVLLVRADIAGHAVHYDYTSTNPRVASPQGGIFSMHATRWGRVDLYSADQRIHSEGARRMLLEPIMFPPEAAA
jgi:hypothetical protein